MEICVWTLAVMFLPKCGHEKLGKYSAMHTYWKLLFLPKCGHKKLGKYSAMHANWKILFLHKN